MRYCKKCGAALNDEMLFCQKCGTKCKEEKPTAAYAVLDDVDINTPTLKKSKNSQGVRTVAAVLVVFLVIILFVILGTKGCSTASNDGGDQSSQSSVQSGEDYELVVWQTFWEGASQSLGVEYSDYKMAHTVYDYIQDFTTSDGYTAHYYLIKTAFETKNVLGQDVLHPVTARCYYVPDYSDTVFVTYMTLDGETVLFDEEKEDWLMGMGGSKSPTTNTETGDGKADETVSTDTPVQNEKPTQNNTNANSTKPNESNTNTTKPNQSQTNTENGTTQHACAFGDWEYYSQGQHQRYCTSCYEAENANHTWDNGKVAKQPTCSAEGEKVYSCTACDGTKNEAIAKLAHNFTEKIESNKYLKSKATYTTGAVYYYSCACGEVGTETFSLNNRVEWITTDALRQGYNLSSGVAYKGQEEITIFHPDGNGTVGVISVGSAVTDGTVQRGTYNGCSIRFYYASNGYGGGQWVFNYDDLVSAGII